MLAPDEIRVYMCRRDPYVWVSPVIYPLFSQCAAHLGALTTAVRTAPCGLLLRLSRPAARSIRPERLARRLRTSDSADAIETERRLPTASARSSSGRDSISIRLESTWPRRDRPHGIDRRPTSRRHRSPTRCSSRASTAQSTGTGWRLSNEIDSYSSSSAAVRS